MNLSEDQREPGDMDKVVGTERRTKNRKSVKNAFGNKFLANKCFSTGSGCQQRIRKKYFGMPPSSAMCAPGQVPPPWACTPFLIPGYATGGISPGQERSDTMPYPSL